jgi:dienelactone hydrolase
MADDELLDFERTTFEHDGQARTVLRLGTGPAVLVIAEIPGITPKVADFARTVAGIGCTAVLPHLFGTPGVDPTRDAKGVPGSVAHAMRSMVPACVSREFTILATGRTSPVVAWLRALVADEHARCGGPGVGAVGMCFTGGFALAMAVDDRMLAPVLAQPSLPLGITKAQRQTTDIAPDDLRVVRDRCAAGLQVLGLRFQGDRLCPPERFQHLHDVLGDGFVSVELEDSSANPDADMSPHSVLTEHLVDEPGSPTRAALDQVLDLFRAKLLDVT